MKSFCISCGSELIQYDESMFTVSYVCVNCMLDFYLRVNVTMGNELTYSPIMPYNLPKFAAVVGSLLLDKIQGEKEDERI